MPSATALERCDRALVAFAAIMGARAMTLDLSPEEMKSWSQNLRHSNVLSTFNFTALCSCTGRQSLFPRGNAVGVLTLSQVSDDGQMITEALKYAGLIANRTIDHTFGDNFRHE